MDVNIDKVSSTAKNIIYLAGLVAYVVWAFFTIESNMKAIEINDARSEKRYKRGMEYAKDHETRLRKLEAKINQIIGANEKD